MPRLQTSVFQMVITVASGLNRLRLMGFQIVKYISTFEGGGVSGMLTFADMGEGGI